METQLDVGRGLKVTNKVRSAMANKLFSPRMRELGRKKSEVERKLKGAPHVISAFLQVDDPYSWLLAHYLPALTESYDVELELYRCEALGEEFQPAPEMLADYAFEDGGRVARELGVAFAESADTPPPGFDEMMTGARDAEGRLQKLGHYNSAMLHYGGEWYWGVDRLHYLTERLDDLGVRKSGSHNPVLASIQRAMQVSLPVTPPAAARDLPPLEFFLSMRSPYSILALPRVFALADAFGLELEIRLVLPMVMRGMQVPKPKLVYIASDTVREAERHNVPFGKLADPVGEGIERLYAVHRYARAENRERDFLLNAASAVWAEGVDVVTDDGMRKITARTGLFWPEACEAMQRDSWRDEVETNRAYMMASGCWGVPTLRFGDFVTWGQDRIWLLARHIEDLCESGDGILV